MDHTTKVYNAIRRMPDWDTLLHFTDWTNEKGKRWASDVRMVTLMLKASGVLSDKVDQKLVSYDELTWALYLRQEADRFAKKVN